VDFPWIGRVLSAVHTQFCESSSAVEPAYHKGGSVAVDLGKAAGIWPGKSTNHRIPHSSKGVYHGPRRQLLRCGRCIV